MENNKDTGDYYTKSRNKSERPEHKASHYEREYHDREYHEREYHGRRHDFKSNYRGNKYSYRRDRDSFKPDYHYSKPSSYLFQRGNFRYSREPPFIKQNKRHSRPPSPVEGSEEYMNKKIQKTSEIIMRHLLTPEENINASDITHSQSRLNKKDHVCDKHYNEHLEPERTNESVATHVKSKKPITYNVEEIHEKIMNHLTKLNEGRKKNFITTKTSIFDSAIQQIVKQKRLEISRALRNVCLNSTKVSESTEFINSIIPDMGIKIEDLPQEVLEALQNTFSSPQDLEESQNEGEHNQLKDTLISEKRKAPTSQVKNSEISKLSKSNATSTTTANERKCKRKKYESDSNSSSEPINGVLRMKECHKRKKIERDRNSISEPTPNALRIRKCRKRKKLAAAAAETTILDDDLNIRNSQETESVDNENAFDVFDTHTNKEIVLGYPEDMRNVETTSHLESDEAIIEIKQEIPESDEALIDIKQEIPETQHLMIPEKDIQHENSTEIIDILLSNVGMNSLVEVEDNMEGCIINSDLESISNSDNKQNDGSESENSDDEISQSCSNKEEMYIESDNTHDETPESSDVNKVDASTQVDKKQFSPITINSLLKSNFYSRPARNFIPAVKRMFIIDKFIEELTAYRQKMFNDIINKKTSKRKKAKKRKETKNNTKNMTFVPENNSVHSVEIHQSISKEVAVPESESNGENEERKLVNISEKILVLKVCEDKLLAATEGGKIYFLNLEGSVCSSVLDVTMMPITSLAYCKEESGKPYLFVGSCESSIKVYNFYSRCLLQKISLNDSVQCMDENWGYLFVGCLRGTIVRYCIKRCQLVYQDNFDNNPIFVLKATQEGARRVLLIGSRNSPVVIRDAMNGLHLRTLEIMQPTIYSMIIHKHLVVCGTTISDILVFNFHNGNLEHTFKATNGKGVGCMKVLGKCLFASCHNGSIYVFNLDDNSLLGILQGPGGVITSMEVVNKQVMVGTLSANFSSIPISQIIVNEMS